MKRYLYVQAIVWLDANDENGAPMRLDDIGPDYVAFRHTIVEAVNEDDAYTEGHEWMAEHNPLLKDTHFRHLRTAKKWFMNDYVVEIGVVPTDVCADEN